MLARFLDRNRRAWVGYAVSTWPDAGMEPDAEEPLESESDMCYAAPIPAQKMGPVMDPIGDPVY